MNNIWFRGYKKYIRDGRAPIPKKAETSRVMSANKGKNTKSEIILRKYLSKAGLRSYRLNPKNVPGRPDISFTKKKVAIFVHGCFWHRCPKCKFPLPKSNRNFWAAKFTRNKARDKRKEKELKLLGWKVLVIWEHELNKNQANVVKKIINIISRQRDVV